MDKEIVTAGDGDPALQKHMLPARQHLRRLGNVFSKNPLYFITCCTRHRDPILTTESNSRIIVEALRNSATFHGWVVGKYVVMPDHVHFFARPTPNAKSLSDYMRDWRKWTSVKISGSRSPLWQPEFFDHVLRSASSYSEKWEYVRENPVRAGLATNPESWPHAGECELLTY